MTKDESTNQILAEVRSVKAMVINQGKILKKHADKIDALEEVNKIASIQKQAIADYVAAEQRKTKNRDEAEYARTKLKLLRDLSPLIVAAIALAYAVLTRR